MEAETQKVKKSTKDKNNRYQDRKFQQAERRYNNCIKKDSEKGKEIECNIKIIMILEVSMG